MGFVVTGGGRGVGRAIVERLTGVVVVIEFDAEALAWADGHAGRIVPVIGDAADPAVAERAAELAEPLQGWVNNAAVFRDAWLHEAGADEVIGLIGANLNPAVVGCAAAIRAYLRAGRPGAIVNVSSHQAQRPVRGSLPYATAKAATEGLTRALAVDYGPRGIRVNAVALGVDRDRTFGRASGGAGPARRKSTSSGRSGCCSRWAGWGVPRRWRTRWPSCCPSRPPSSTARSCRSTAGGPRSAATRRNAADQQCGADRITCEECPQPLESPSVIRDRAVSVADYLLAVRAQMERPARTVPADAHWLDALPDHPACQVGPGRGRHLAGCGSACPTCRRRSRSRPSCAGGSTSIRAATDRRPEGRRDDGPAARLAVWRDEALAAVGAR